MLLLEKMDFTLMSGEIPGSRESHAAYITLKLLVRQSRIIFKTKFTKIMIDCECVDSVLVNLQKLGHFSLGKVDVNNFHFFIKDCPQ